MTEKWIATQSLGPESSLFNLDSCFRENDGNRTINYYIINLLGESHYQPIMMLTFDINRSH